MFQKRDVCQHFAALKTGKRHQFYVFLIRIIVSFTKGTFASFGLNFNQKLANVLPGQNVGKRTPLQIWGATRAPTRSPKSPAAQNAASPRSQNSQRASRGSATATSSLSGIRASADHAGRSLRPRCWMRTRSFGQRTGPSRLKKSSTVCQTRTSVVGRVVARVRQ